MILIRIGMAVAMVLGLAACGTTRMDEAMALASPAPQLPSHRIFVATTRAHGAAQNVAFDGSRSARAAFAYVDVSVPPGRVGGEFSRPRRGVGDPQKHFMTRDVGFYRNPASMQAALAYEAQARGGRALVFVHGYNTSFDEAVFRLTQIVHDSGYRGTPLLFTWASGGRAIDYMYDRESATAARDALEATLRLVAQSGAARVDIVAHSMGSWVTMEALRQLAISGDAELGGKLGDVILASPDIDVDVFKSQMARIGKPKNPYVVLLSEDDRALRLSSVIAGNKPRVGDYAKASDLGNYGVTVIDMSSQKGSSASNHHKFSENTTLLNLLGRRLSDPTAAAETASDITQRISDYAKGLNKAISAASNAAHSAPTLPVERTPLTQAGQVTEPEG